MRPAWLRIDGLRTRLVLVFIAIVVIIAGGTAGVVSLMARSWIYFNAQDVATAQFRDELQSVNGTPVDGLTPAGLAPVFPSDMTLIADGEVVRRGSVDPATITPGFDDGLNSTGLIRFERLDSERILVGMSVYVVDTTAGMATTTRHWSRPSPSGHWWECRTSSTTCSASSASPSRLACW